MGVKNFFAFILSIILVIILIILVMSLGSNTLLSPQVYTTGLEKAGFYNFLDENTGNISQNTFIDTSNKSFKETIEMGIYGLVDYVNGRNDDIILTAKIDQQKLRDFFISQVNNLSICRGQQNDESPCRPANISSEEFLDEYLKEHNLSFFEKDEVDLVEVYGLSKGSPGRENFDRIRNAVSLYKSIFYSLMFSAILLSVLIFFMKGRRYLGINLIIAGAISLCMAFFTQELFNKGLGQVEQITTNLVLNLEILIVHIYSSIFNKFLVYSGILLVLGIILTLLPSHQVKVKKKNKVVL